MKKLIIGFLLMVGTAFGQAVRYDTTAFQLTYNNLFTPPSNGTVAVFNYPGAGTLCSGGGCVAATTYTSDTAAVTCSAAQPLTPTGSTVCSGALGNSGNFGFWALPGRYQACVTAANSYTSCVNVFPPLDVSVTNTFTASQKFTAGISTSSITPIAAGGSDLGTAALPFGNLWLGAAATNNAKITGVFTAARIFTLPDTASDTFAFLNATQTLVNKTLTSPTLNSPVANTATLTGLTNGTGLQAFNTTTTCTTASTISTPCTTAAITLPVGYSDTNYRVECTGLGVTNFPQIQTVTKSNTTFTITLNNLTAAAATYTSFDCMVSHN